VSGSASVLSITAILRLFAHWALLIMVSGRHDIALDPGGWPRFRPEALRTVPEM
jgi:hypothetical protein